MGWWVQPTDALDLDGDGQDEMFFYRDDGLFRYYNINPNGTIGGPIAQGDGYTKNWSSITAVDLDGAKSTTQFDIGISAASEGTPVGRSAHRGESYIDLLRR